MGRVVPLIHLMTDNVLLWMVEGSGFADVLQEMFFGQLMDN